MGWQRECQANRKLQESVIAGEGGRGEEKHAVQWEEIAGQRGASARLARRGFPFGRAGEAEGQAPAGGVAGGGRRAAGGRRRAAGAPLGLKRSKGSAAVKTRDTNNGSDREYLAEPPVIHARTAPTAWVGTGLADHCEDEACAACLEPPWQQPHPLHSHTRPLECGRNLHRSTHV